MLFPLPGLPFPLLLYLKNSYLPFKTQSRQTSAKLLLIIVPTPVPLSRTGAVQRASEGPSTLAH